MHVFSARWRLNNQQGADEMKISELERSIEAASVATQESVWKYEEVFWGVFSHQHLSLLLLKLPAACGMKEECYSGLILE